MYPVDGGKAVVKMTDEMKEASLRQGSDNTRMGLGFSRVAFVMTLQAYAESSSSPLSIRALDTLPIHRLS